MTSADSIDQRKEMIISEIKENYFFNLFCLLPGVDPRENQIRRNAERLGISKSDAVEFERKLIDVKLWTKTKGLITSNFDLLDFGDLSVQDYLSLSVCIISKLSSDKSYEYDTLSLATSRKHIKKFVKTVNLALKELYNDSLKEVEEKNCLFSWTHTGVIELEVKNKSKYWEKT